MQVEAVIIPFVNKHPTKLASQLDIPRWRYSLTFGLCTLYVSGPESISSSTTQICSFHMANTSHH